MFRPERGGGVVMNWPAATACYCYDKPDSYFRFQAIDETSPPPPPHWNKHSSAKQE
jgi:hypothetical protein